jgi:hypothetical protein
MSEIVKVGIEVNHFWDTVKQLGYFHDRRVAFGHVDWTTSRNEELFYLAKSGFPPLHMFVLASPTVTFLTEATMTMAIVRTITSNIVPIQGKQYRPVTHLFLPCIL